MKTQIKALSIASAVMLAATFFAAAVPVEVNEPLAPVTVKNFERAESDKYFSDTVKMGGFGKFFHYRTPTPNRGPKSRENEP
jgi:hypothetical protein